MKARFVSIGWIILLWMLGPVASGASQIGQPFDLQGFVDQQVKEGTTRIVIPPGRYRVTPQNRQHLALCNLKDLQIIADDVEMICTETTRALTVANCVNVTVRGLVIDYDPLPFTQGWITAIAADRQVYEVSLFDGYPEADSVRNFKYEVFRPDTRTLRCEDRNLSKIEVLDARHLKLTIPGSHERDPEQVGDMIVIGSEFAPHGSIPHAVYCSHNRNVRLESISLFASNCFGFLETDCDGSIYQHCRIDHRDPVDDPVVRASPRLRSLDADAFHSKYALKGPSYLGCAARFMGDDCINICGDYHLITAARGRELRVLAKGGMNVQPGDPVELVGYDGVRLPDAKAVAIQAAGPIVDDEREFLGRQQMDANLKSARGLGTAFRVTLDREVALVRGSVLCAANRVGNGFVVRDCSFGFNRSRGILIKGSNGEISGNHLEGCRMSAILVSPEYWWLEAGSSSDLLITNNTITACNGVPIRIEAIGGNGQLAQAGAHRNLTVTGNRISGCTMPGILVTSTAGLHVHDNTLDRWITTTAIPDTMRRAGLTELKPVVEIHCQP